MNLKHSGGDVTNCDAASGEDAVRDEISRITSHNNRALRIPRLEPESFSPGVALLSLAARNSVTSRQFRCHRWCNRWVTAQFARPVSGTRYGPCAYVLACVRCASVHVAASGKDWCHGTASRWSWPGSHCRYIDGFKRFYGTNKRFPLNAHANYWRKTDSCKYIHA